jgi:hypothetical protein
MKNRACCLSVAVLGFTLLVVLTSPAAAGESAARGGAVWNAALPPQAASCGLCKAAQERCSVKCFSLADKAGLGACLTACDNAAAACTACDDQVTLRSEDLVEKMPWLAKGLEKAACHSTTPCDYNIYGSCASWSGYTDCDDPFCGSGPRCGDNCEPWGPCPGPAWKQKQERYRVCFDQYGNSCTEWQRITISSCGC